jgi:hypothetical protein
MPVAPPAADFDHRRTLGAGSRPSPCSGAWLFLRVLRARWAAIFPPCRPSFVKQSRGAEPDALSHSHMYPFFVSTMRARASRLGFEEGTITTAYCPPSPATAEGARTGRSSAAKIAAAFMAELLRKFKRPKNSTPHARLLRQLPEFRKRFSFPENPACGGARSPRAVPTVDGRMVGTVSGHRRPGAARGPAAEGGRRLTRVFGGAGARGGER